VILGKHLFFFYFSISKKKIFLFSLATWTTYKNYREQLAQHDSVQLEKKNVEYFV